MKPILAGLMLALLVNNAAALTMREIETFAAANVTRSAQQSGARYLVSGVLRKDGTSNVIKLVHSIEAAGTPDAAIGAFTRKALVQHPGNSLLDTLVSPAPSTAANCGFQATI